VVGAKDSRPAHSGSPVVALSLLLQVLAANSILPIHSLLVLNPSQFVQLEIGK
jgi:hypothetical protein